MLRFIIERRMDNSYGAVTKHYETVDLDVPELERLLTGGGMGQGGPGYDLRDLFAVEVLTAAETAPSEPGELPEELFDGAAVYAAMTDHERKTTSPENVGDVLDALVRLIRTRGVDLPVGGKTE